jgi:hypothetical protein
MPESIVRWIPGHCFTLPGMMCPLGLRQLADTLFQALDREWEHALFHDLVDHFDGWRMPPEPPNGQIN